jgi:hypothetical protein
MTLTSRFHATEGTRAGRPLDQQGLGEAMPVVWLCVPQPRTRLRPVIVIVIYLATFRIAADGAIPLALGGALAALAAGTHRRPQPAGSTERAR